MKGLRRRMAVAFLSIIALLMLSGLISMLELGHLSRGAEQLQRTTRAHEQLIASAAQAAEAEREAVLRSQPDSTWLHEVYLPLHREQTVRLAQYQDSAREELAPRAERVGRNAYRTVTPVLLSLLVMIVAVLLLYYFTVLYCVRPIVAMNRALGQYLQFHLPFTVKTELKDEVADLKEGIDTLLSQQGRIPTMQPPKHK